MELIKIDDVREFIPSSVPDSKIKVMIDDAIADATRVAPCLLELESLELEPAKLGLVLSQIKSILRAALARWGESGSGALQQQTQSIGPWSQTATADTRQERKGMYWPSEITALQDICKRISPTESSSRAANVDQLGAPLAASNHQPWCSITWGSWCSCGAALTRGEYPLFEGGALG